MSLFKRWKWFWSDFTVDGRRRREPLKTTSWVDAKEKERQVIEDARRHLLPARARLKQHLFLAIDEYLADKKIRCRPRTIEFENERLSVVKKHFKDVPISAITADAISRYQSKRRDAGISNRTINMDVGVLSRVLDFHKCWRRLKGEVKFLPEHNADIGRALTQDEQDRLLQVAASKSRWEPVYCAAIVAANTSMRPVEVKHLRRCDVDLVKKLLHVRRSKNETSHRVIPLNASAVEAAARMFERADLLGHTEPEHYLWPACQWGRYDATKPMLKWDTAWRALRDEAGLQGLRFHDLRHTVITELAEMGVADHVLESISGHLSRRMLEHYSHIRIDAKRQALDALDNLRRVGDPANGNGRPANDAEIETIVEVSDDLTSQSRHSLLLQGSPPSGKLLIPLSRRDGREAEGARLESVCRGNSTEGSNPSLSANFRSLFTRKLSRRSPSINSGRRWTASPTLLPS